MDPSPAGSMRSYAVCAYGDWAGPGCIADSQLALPSASRSSRARRYGKGLLARRLFENGPAPGAHSTEPPRAIHRPLAAPRNRTPLVIVAATGGTARECLRTIPGVHAASNLVEYQMARCGLEPGRATCQSSGPAAGRSPFASSPWANGIAWGRRRR